MTALFNNIFGKRGGQKESDIFNKNIVTIGNELISSSPILISEKMFGDFYCLDELVIDELGDITGNIATTRCVIKGKISGNVLCLKNIIIKSTAIIEGEITAGTVEVESGAVINGCINLQRDLQAPELIKKVKECQAEENQRTVPVIKYTALAPEKIESFLHVANDDSVEKQLPEKVNVNSSKWW
jgi:cytoskeletal protein CcmA (bactofilin family)